MFNVSKSPNVSAEPSTFVRGKWKMTKTEGSAETLGLLETLNIIYTILTRVTSLFLNI